MKPEDVTEQILGAWDEVVGADAAVETEEPEPEEEPEGAEVETSEEEPDEAEEAEEEEPDGEEEEPGEDAGEEAESGEGDEGDEPEVGEEPVFETDNPEIQAFLAKFQGNVEKALRYGLQSQQALSRMDGDKKALSRRVQELESQLAEASAFSGSGLLLSEPQRAWVGEALESGNPLAYVREAVKAKEFDLARAVCAAWGDHAPYEALRAAQMVDYTESSLASVEPEETGEPIDHGELLRVLAEHFPDMPEYAEQMTVTMAQLGEMHPLVQEARSNDPQEAVRGVVGIYEIARASARTTADARTAVKNGAREKARSARKSAVVTSGGASPSAGETPKSVKIGPGLTLKDLEEEWARNS